MVRLSNKLTALSVKRETRPGVHSDGGGLYLRVGAGGAKSWVAIYRLDGKRHETGLGSAGAVSLARAREKASELRAQVADGIDPIATRKATRRERAAAMTFGQVADEFISVRSAGVRGTKTVARWKRSIGEGGYSEPIRGKLIRDVDTDAIVDILRPIWSDKPETANGVRGYIEAVIDLGKTKGQFVGENPARWKGHLENLLAKQSRKAKHHAAMPYKDVPSFAAKLRERAGDSARALEFLILCASRTTEVRLAPWAEFDLANGLWTIPAGRMKGAAEHIVPLSARAIEILKELGPGKSSEPVFSGGRAGEPMSNMAMEMTMRRMKVDFTVHGFRSAFRDWAGDETHHEREIAEAALAHTIGSSAERAYRRGTAIEKRRQLMTDWANFLDGEKERVAPDPAAQPPAERKGRRVKEDPYQVKIEF